MSLILDALNKADAERRAGQLHDTLSKGALQPSVARSALSSNTLRGRWLKASIVGVLGIVISGWLVWQMQSGHSILTTGTPEFSAVAPMAPALVSSASSAKSAPVTESIVSMASTPSPAVTTSTLPVPPPVLQAMAEMEPPPARSQARAKIAQPAESLQGASQAAMPVLTLAQLPQQLRSEIPLFSITGSIYSTDPKERMLLVDKRMLREGDEIASGLVLDAVMQKGALLRYKGYVFKVDN